SPSSIGDWFNVLSFDCAICANSGSLYFSAASASSLDANPKTPLPTIALAIDVAKNYFIIRNTSDYFLIFYMFVYVFFYNSYCTIYRKFVGYTHIKIQ